MKKLLLIALIIVIPALAFADFQIGALALLNRSLSDTSTGKITASDFTYGLETRLNIWIFQGGISALYFPGGDYSYDTVIAFTDVGLCLDLWILRLGAGVGPNLGFIVDKSYTGTSDAQKLGFNVKMAGDLMLGNLDLGVVGYYYLENLADLKTAGSDMSKVGNWMLGVTLLFKIF
jgi:hypothetical protein